MNLRFKTKPLISINHSRKIKSSLMDFTFIVLFFIIAFMGIKNPAPLPNHLYLTIHYLWLASPLPLSYISLRLIKIPSLISAYTVLIAFKLLEYISDIKLSLTGEVLSWNDLFSRSNISIANHYLTPWPVFCLFLAILFCVILFFISRAFYTTKKNKASLAISFMIILPFSFYTHFSSLFGEDSLLSRKMILLAKEMNVIYKSWNWPENLQDNGMAMHIVMTSSRKSAPLANENNKEMYDLEKRTGSTELPKHKTIIYVLCESCWYDNANFKELIAPILNEGFVTFRATSPVYGGGTANVEFEMLTGLPSNSRVLSGIIYQEYSSQFKSHSDTIASALKTKGFITYAAHNYLKEFWHRDIVYQKFGFEKFDGLYEMSNISLPDQIVATKKKWQWQPDDYLLYKSAIDQLKKADKKNIFMNLITMSTHGPYPHENDSGEYVYTYELKQAIDRFVEFYKEVREIDPEAVVVIYGDHKPALNKFFMNKSVLPTNLFSKTGDHDNDFVFKWDINPTDYGDVPVFVAAGNNANLKQLVQEANNQPYFCVSSLIDKYLINSALPSFRYNIKNECSNTNYSYEKKINAMPSWVYSLALFEDNEL
ncbi:sulfatase-like hydrolase/transferase [Enterobacter asburiae]|uniref:LTA synthase family protein n=1 Tax=Enterobacter asburiae TaxID=61645 RepID=UPI0009311A8B|nr:alkaline phosphatase family protein [Enterobacter asburiae]MDL4612618.1 sulfatase-like hydrolase/transferase [Enterobacter asburiae]